MTAKDSTEEWRQYWAEMEAGCRRIQQYIHGLDETRFYDDGKTFDAVLRNLELIHKASRSLPDDIHPRLREDDWRTLNSVKEITANARFKRNPMGLWQVVDEQVPALLQALREVHKEDVEVKTNKRLRQRGRNAVYPWELPQRGWRDVGWRVWDQLWRNNIFIVSAGVAFYWLLAIFPALAVLVSIYGLLFNAADVSAQLVVVADVLPAEAWSVIHDQLQTLTSRSQTTLGLGAAFGFLITLWSARAGMGGALVALNIAYEEIEKRSMLRFYLTALLLTLGAIVFSVMALAIIVALPTVLEKLGFDAQTEWLINGIRWPLLAVGVMLALAILYRLGPSRNPPRWEWVSLGSVVATVLWILGSLLFSFYVANFGSYNETYGSVGAIVILMLWFWLSAFIILMGAVLNAETEHQTKKDTTTGKPKPMGLRNAHMADTLGRRP